MSETNNTNAVSPTFAFFGTDDFSALVLERLAGCGYLPGLAITAPDRPQGRSLKMTPPTAKVWANEYGIPVFQPERLSEQVQEKLRETDWDFFLVASYGKIIPEAVLNTPARGSLNIHPSLLPDLRGAAPIQHTILERERAGVSIMKMDAKMDHGSILAKKEITLQDWPPSKRVLEAVTANAGADLLALHLPEYLSGEATLTEQDHDAATYTKKITKTDAEIDLSANPETNLRKIRAFDTNPKPYFFHDRAGTPMRVIITAAHTEKNRLVLDQLIPEGKQEMSRTDFVRGFGEPAPFRES